ncbi:hypothetical protein Asp14428_21560 [Actinoplanes sp. NBRC 14428]|nr:hypothetical protein Asp14428_21560 [Actinoplanes sp. NBRC 14428]
MGPDRPTYNTPICFRIQGRLDPDTLRRALATVVARHEMLRTSMSEGADGPVQTVHPAVPVEIPLIDVPGTGLDERRATARECVRELSRRVFRLDEAPLWRAALLRVAEDEHLFLFVVHHVVFDGWSLGLFCAELARAYRGDEMPRGARLDYGDYVLWERERLGQERVAELGAYWRERLAGAPPLELPADRPRPPEQSHRGALLDRTIALPGTGAVAALARSLRTTPGVVCTAAFLALLHRQTGADDLVVGMPTANREHAEVEPVVGYFVNMLPLRADLSGDPTFRQLVQRTHEVVLDSVAHGSLPFGKLVEAVRPPREASRSPLFQIVFAYQNLAAHLDLPGMRVDHSEVDTDTVRFDQTWDVVDGPDGLRLGVRYSTDLFDRSTVETLIDRYATVFRAVLADQDVPVSRIPLLRDDERDELLHRWNGPERPVPETTLPEMFARQVARRPDAVALVVDGVELTYARLDRDADRLAHVLRGLGAGPDRLVALCLPRCPDLVVAMLAVLKAGAGYLPLDPTHPAPRIGTILADATPVAVVTTAGSVADGLPDSPVPVLRLDADADRIAAAPEGPLVPSAAPGDLAYAIFTSGSTGSPKGVLIEHRAAVNFIGAMQELFALTAEDRVLGFASATFDVSVFEIFSALLTGARLYLVTDEERMDVERLQKLLESAAITVTDLPPPLMALLEPERLPALRIVFAGLDAFPGELVNRWNPGRRFFNGYGPTECTVTMITHECEGRWDGSPPIGLPIANHVAHVLDPAGEPVPVGVPGELVIGGTGLARGYLNAPELTARRFYADPFGTSPGGRLYRTGDLVKRRPDGAIVFLGRLDQQVKIRGLRIEPGEIESVLTRRPEVAQVAVRPVTPPGGDRQLVCYVAGRDGPPDVFALREWVAGHLPAYMVPARFVVLPELPLTASGKVDRRRLPEPPAAEEDTAGPVRYATELERELAEEIVGPVLGLAAVDPEADFFALGGHSLSAARVLSRVRSRYDAAVGLADFFRTPTLRGLSTLVGQRRSAAAAGEDELLAILASMTDAEAEALLAEASDETGR